MFKKIMKKISWQTEYGTWQKHEIVMDIIILVIVVLLILVVSL